MKIKKIGRSNFDIKVKIAAAAMVCLLFGSCVSLKTPKRDDLVRLKTPQLIGKYATWSSDQFKTHLGKDTIIPVDLWRLLGTSSETDSVTRKQATHMELRLTDKNHVTAILYKGDVALKKEVIKGRVRRGYFRKKTEADLMGVPPFYWSLSSQKVQFGIGKEQQLFVDAAAETGGSILIIGASSGGFTRSYTVPLYVK
ncbi:hypothetical protein [Pedobacter metabolipauper]|uniref:Uncharacterized protein n=1 Tax=Pedobacter metabolipauper TaxID=425513 RepID=A0A4R6SNW6_9SPHI|nr:hypothetical protein [Pedobacter metabolipauper]TDQ06216.1 hypothetical protein ATK78_4597 [Pedobacter metabolipauper]